MTSAQFLKIRYDIMGREIICLAVMILGMVTTANTTTACSNTNTFGNNCEYQCHCAGGLACGDDGSCPGGCASGWEGEYCQRGNAAAGKSSEQSTTNGSYSSSLALDGNTKHDFLSCSHTTNQDQPWWQVDLGKEYVLFTVKIWHSIEEDVRECKTTKRGTEYKGTMNTTREGYKCDEWLNPNPPFKYKYSPANSSNYCRNPDDGTEPWCYTTVPEHSWEYCNVPWCKEGDVRECKTTQRGPEYGGTLSITRKGFKCDEWLNPNPLNKHNYSPANSSNYCRNPENDETEPWCYTTEREWKNRWDHCDVPWCKAKLNNFKISMNSTLCHHYMYNGTVGFGQTVDIRCDTPVVGRHLKIQLMDSSTVLTLCEVTIQAFQYRACSNKYYGPNCNNRCQCANDVTCDDKTGLCPSGACNDRFTGPYCNIEIPSVSKNGSSTPTSISVQWQYTIHDSAYDAENGVKLDLRYQENTSSSSSGYAVSSPRPGMMSANVTKLKPSTEYRFHIQLSFKSSKTEPVSGPTANFQTESCTGYMVVPVITVTSNKIDKGQGTWPNRVALVIKAEVPGMIAGCKKELDVYVKKTNETNYMKLTKAGQTYPITSLTAFTEYDIKATVTSPDGYEKDNSPKIRTAEDVPSAPTIAKAGASPTSVSIRITPPDPPYGIIKNYKLGMWEAGSSGRTYIYSYGPANLTHTFDKLKLNRTYNFKAQAFTSAGGGAWSEEISIITVENIPGPPNTLLAQEHTTNSLVLAWTKPTFSNGILGNYKVICTPLFSYDDEVNTKRMNYAKESNPSPEVENITVSGLTAATEYNCSVAAQNSKGYGPSIWLRNWTKPEAPNVPESLLPNIAHDMTSDTTITIVIKKLPKSLKAGSIRSIRVGVEEITRRSVPLPADRQALLTDYETANATGRLSYIAAELEPTSGPFVIGDGKTYGGYYNAPLEKGHEYGVIFGMVLTAGEESSVAYRTHGKPITVQRSKLEGSVVGLAVGLTIGILVIPAAIIIPAVIVIRRRRAALLTTL